MKLAAQQMLHDEILYFQLQKIDTPIEWHNLVVGKQNNCVGSAIMGMEAAENCIGSLHLIWHCQFLKYWV